MTATKYEQLPVATREVLGQLDMRDLQALQDVIRLFVAIEGDPVRGPLVRDFLMNAKSDTLLWLRDARQEEIKLVMNATSVVQSAKILGGVLKWLVIGGLAILFAAGDLGQTIKNFRAAVMSRFGS